MTTRAQWIDQLANRQSGIGLAGEAFTTALIDSFSRTTIRGAGRVA
jgi:hypothetical protein